MILDALNNIKWYSNISKDIYTGLQFIKTINKDISLGTLKINQNVTAIVSEYNTIKYK